ncbi:MAG TPA: methyltransferase domain-containing protein [Phycisphaerales bacterium]|nr:methyltransferase domain-containing protein [Phycisphaerales bacterium]
MKCGGKDELDKPGTTRLVDSVRETFRARRAQTFRRYFAVGPQTKILDLGSSDGSHIAGVLRGLDVQPANVYIADVRQEAVHGGHQRYGFTPVHLHEDGPLPFPDRFFDIVFCSSVLEHVTISKSRLWECRSDRVFEKLALEHQKAFADQIRRVGIGYFVQTPYRYFPIETHTWLPFVGYMLRRAQMAVIRAANRVWIKRTQPDWYLLSRRDMVQLFPEALIVPERVALLTKSLIAVKTAGGMP